MTSLDSAIKKENNSHFWFKNYHKNTQIIKVAADFFVMISSVFMLSAWDPP